MKLLKLPLNGLQLSFLSFSSKIVKKVFFLKKASFGRFFSVFRRVFKGILNFFEKIPTTIKICILFRLLRGTICVCSKSLKIKLKNYLYGQRRLFMLKYKHQNCLKTNWIHDISGQKMVKHFIWLLKKHFIKFETLIAHQKNL